MKQNLQTFLKKKKFQMLQINIEKTNSQSIANNPRFLNKNIKKQFRRSL